MNGQLEKWMKSHHCCDEEQWAFVNFKQLFYKKYFSVKIYSELKMILK